MSEKPWVDLGSIYEDFELAYGTMSLFGGERSCFFCQHYWLWDNRNWSCELEGKDAHRRFLEAPRYKGQKKLPEMKCRCPGRPTPQNVSS